MATVKIQFKSLENAISGCLRGHDFKNFSVRSAPTYSGALLR